MNLNGAYDPKDEITAVVLAGGLARRMGGEDKGLVKLNGRPMVDYIIACLRPQVGRLLINANRNLDAYGRLGQCEVIADSIGNYAGPLAGMASGLEAAQTPYLMTVPCDSPLIAHDLAERMYNSLCRQNAEVAVAHDGERIQPVFALLRCDLLDSIRTYLETGERKVDRWYAKHRLAPVDLSDRLDTFLNINTPEERTALERRLKGTSC